MDALTEISQLVVRERQNRVRRNADGLAACFHPDATVTTSWMAGSVAQFVTGGPAESGPRPPVVNRCGPPVIRHRDTRGFVELPSTTTRWITVNGVEAELVSCMRLLYRVEARDGVWKISDLTAVNEGDRLTAAVPGTRLEIDPAAISGLRHSYRFLAYTRALEGEQVGDDLYGTDRPDQLDELYARASRWLEDGTGTPSQEQISA